MSDGGDASNDSIASSSTSPSPSHSCPINEESGSDPKGTHVKLQDLFEKYQLREKEIDRLEKQNEEYRDKLIRTIRDREEYEAKVKAESKEKATKYEEMERKVVELDCTLKVTRDRANAQEVHFNKTTQALTEKFNKQVNDLTRKMEIAEGEKNQSVIKYAMREAELMKLQAEIVKKDERIKHLEGEVKEMKESMSQEHLMQLEKANVDIKVEMEKIKHEKFDIDNRLKMSEKRADASLSSVSDLKQQVEVLRRQVIALKEDKSTIQEEHRSLVQRFQAEEERIKAKEDQVQSEHIGKEELYKKIVHDAARAKERNSELSSEIENLLKENTSLMGDLEEATNLVKEQQDNTALMQKRLNELIDIESKVNAAIDAQNNALKEKEEAEADKATAEAEAAECRKQAERMLEITENLTQRNTSLLDELAQVREKASSLQTQLIEEEGARQRIERNVASTEQDIESVKTPLLTEIDALKKKLAETTKKAEDTTRQLDEERTDNVAYRKKTSCAIKELKQEAMTLRRQLANIQATSDISSLEIPHSSSTLASESSRASSITSIDQIGGIYKRDRDVDSERESLSAKEKEKDSDKESIKEREDDKDSGSRHSVSPAVEETSVPAHQAMIEKIVKLQKQLLRRNEKIEFLEEHVRQCLDELQKKTKVIQYYTLREEASLLLPADEAMHKVPIAKKTASSYALMGSIFTGGGSSEKKAALQLATEVNSRLQAVLEDTLLKNINLKDSVDKLGEEISRLSRENRKLTLAQR